ncbi:NADH dehydrogenase FAD-containing subunit [Paenibacillus sambharensis]|uniref:NADH dehydrogenase FAD-containing subunit n=1 Tax=Paenibacillus sambharensis TaxID=1803190 RepID=A0A2W1L7I8_9BACL|nr:ABC transporter permease [Paenibacillus sambharensis]PZD94769.1 NADH dehydrogenase FAD-containing subunit [Paenibacillus sambharensis]
MNVEWQKLFKNKMTYLSLIALQVIALLAIWKGAAYFSEEYDLAARLYHDYPDALALFSSHQYWVGLSDTFFSSFYYFVFPLLVSLPVVDSFYKEKATGYLNFELLRVSRRAYFAKKFLFVFVSSFFIFTIPLVLSMLFANAMSGNWNFESYSTAYSKLINGTAALPDTNIFFSQEKLLFSELLQSSVYLYILVYYFIGGLFAGVYACFGLAVSLFLNNRYLILFIPMSIYLGMWTIFTLLGLLAWDPFNFLDPRQPVSKLSYASMIVMFGLLLAVTITTYFIGVKRQRDVFA